MIESGCIPEVGKTYSQFAVDFIPVDYLAGTMFKLSHSDTIGDGKPSIYHIGNPQPLPLNELPDLMGDIRNHGGVGRRASLDAWIDEMLNTDIDEAARLRWNVLKSYLSMGHVMFALEQGETEKRIQEVGGDGLKCPPVDTQYLSRMWKNTH